jgi:hypothetical protein
LDKWQFIWQHVQSHWKILIPIVFCINNSTQLLGTK